MATVQVMGSGSVRQTLAPYYKNARQRRLKNQNSDHSRNANLKSHFLNDYTLYLTLNSTSFQKYNLQMFYSAQQKST